ncbi:MAG: hypothetical protein KAX49_20810 [Halanaerobiales bacterium]|nr:hypothetical protein [Halanaerobiales bacterium]
MIASKEYADASYRVLSIETLNKHGIYISHVTFYNRMKEKGISGPRGIMLRKKTDHLSLILVKSLDQINYGVEILVISKLILNINPLLVCLV